MLVIIVKFHACIDSTMFLLFFYMHASDVYALKSTEGINAHDNRTNFGGCSWHI